jgi:hypothetical protein
MYLEALARATGVSERLAYGFRTELHLADVGNEINTNVHEVTLRTQCIFESILPSVKANLLKVVQCWLVFLITEIGHVCHQPFPKQSFRLQITDSNHVTMDYEIPLLGVSTLLVDDAHELGNLPDTLPHFIIYPLCCQATLLLLNRHGFCCLSADYNTGVLGPDTDL